MFIKKREIERAENLVWRAVTEKVPGGILKQNTIETDF